MSLISLSYTNTELFANEQATEARALVTENLNAWEGVLSILPSRDPWIDTKQRPDQTLTTGPFAGFWEENGNVSPIEADRNSWDYFSDRASASSWRSNEEGSIQNEAEKQANADSYQDLRITPFVRPREIEANVHSMKPNTRVYVFFDRGNVSDQCYPSGGEVGDALVTDDNGELTFFFRLLEESAEKGNRVLRVMDVDNFENRADASTRAEATYAISPRSAYELENGIVSTQRPRVEREATRETVSSRNARTFSNGVAYTFYNDVPDGAFISSLDLFFKEVPSESTRLNVQIRTVENGQPSETIVPYGELSIDSETINTSNDSSAATTVSFDNPVYLQEDTDYAIVLLPEGNARGFEVWISVLGDFDLLTDNRVTGTIGSGSLFRSSANRTWNPFIQEDFKIRIHRAEFDTSGNFTASFHNADIDLLNLGTDSLDGIEVGEVLYGEYFLVLQTQAESFTQEVGETITIEGDTNVTATIRALNYPELYVETNSVDDVVESGDTFTDDESVTWTIETATRAQGKVSQKQLPVVILNESNGHFRDSALVRSQETPSLSVNIESIDNYTINDLRPVVAQLVFEDSELNWQATIFDGSSERTVNIDEGERKALDSEFVVWSKSNEVQNNNGDKTLTFTATGSSERNNLSPIIDDEVIGAQIYNYRINDEDLTDEEDNDGANLSRYFTEPLSLSTQSEDLRIIVDARIPSGASVGVFYKVQNAADDREFDEVEWREMDTLTYTENEFREFDLRVPDAHRNGDDVVEYSDNGGMYAGFNKFAVKFVLRASNTSRYPTLKNLRTIALLV